MMPRSKIVLKQGLSADTLDSLRNYLRQFLDQRHSVEYFDGTVSVYLKERKDLRILKEQFPTLIEQEQDIY